jgi:ubiquinone biosynthesis protein
MVNISSKRKQTSSHYARYRQIAVVLVKHRLGNLIKTLGLERFLPLHLVPPGNPWSKNEYTDSQRTRMALEELGTTFIKIGQILSTRTDVLPSDFTQELSKLQNSLTPIPLSIIENSIKIELGKTPRELFTSFDPEPLGVASIGQAHAATLHDGTEVVIKVHKPGVDVQVAEDLEILRQLAASAEQRSGGRAQYDLNTLVEEIADTLTSEMDYVREGHSAEHFARFFKDDPTIHIPKIYWEFTTAQVITLERIRGINVSDTKGLEKAGFDRKKLAKRTVDIWLKMVFEDSIFHADPHPGNLFVERDGRLGLIDFGMTGLIDQEMLDDLVNAMKGILDRDVDLFIDSFMELGAIGASMKSRTNLRKDLKHVMNHYPEFESGLNVGYNLGELISVVRRNHIQLPANTFLLLKAMSMAQGMGRRLDPELDFFAAVKPYIDDTIKKKYSPSALISRLPSAAAQLVIFGAGLPRRLNRVVKAVERGEFQVQTDVSGLDHQIDRLEKVINRAVIGVIIAAIILALAITGYLGFILRLFLPQVTPTL